jgi:hypothetical protein
VTYDPLDDVVDANLKVDATVIRNLDAFRKKPKLANLPGVDPSAERERLTKRLDSLLDTLREGVEANPTKRWVMAQFQRQLEAMLEEDTEGRDHFGIELEKIMDILGIESSDGLLAFYLGGL